ncbi:F0F1 ATP synthase subunit delta [Paenibacillus sp. GCM10027626]|uniref:F0F1 ATP synthase subunit delta n=1 Tax=Paenibacillus sp. GCM10027626 TaxID=3273411 RepID=UPI003640321C
MSRESAVAKRYAQALFEIAREQNVIAEVEQQLQLVVNVLDGDAEIRKFFGLPNISVAKKIALLQSVLAEKVSAVVMHTVEILIARGRQKEIGSVYAAYTKVAGEALGRSQATVYTAKLLSPEELAKVETTFGAIAGKAIQAQQVVQPSLLGGVQVRIGDRLYDGSLSGKLARLEQSLKSQAL